MKKAFFFLCLFAFGAASAQTKLIAYKSHSGASELLAAGQNGLLEAEDSDFGLPSYRTVVRIDSVIFLSDSTSVMVRTKGKADWNEGAKPYDLKRGRDTLRNHPLFRNRHALDSIKKEWKSFFRYADYAGKPVEEVIFIGFDNNKKAAERKKENATPAASGNNRNKGGNGLLIGLALFSMAGAALVALRARKQKTGWQQA